MCSPIPIQVTAVLCGTSARVVIITHRNSVLHAVCPCLEASVRNEASFSSEWLEALNKAGEGWGGGLGDLECRAASEASFVTVT